MKTFSLGISIDGSRYQVSVDSRMTLLDLMRERLNIYASKKGCDVGQCGACTVLINGERRLSCLVFASTLNDAVVTTAAGVSRDPEYAPLLEALINRDGLQCGYCTPGQVCSMVGLMSEAQQGMASYVTPDLEDSDATLNRAEVAERLSGNLCRCGAYHGITDAFLDVYNETV